MKYRFAIVVICALLTAGCPTYRLVEVRQVSIGSAYVVEPQIRWSAETAGKWEIWTVDGPSLQAVRFLTGIVDGEAIVTMTKSDKLPTFRQAMTPNEIMELVVDSYTAAGASAVKPSNLRPERFGSADGFRFDFTYLAKNGLEAQGIVKGVVWRDRLYLVTYSGVGGYYFHKFQPDVERLLQSIQLK